MTFGYLFGALIVLVFVIWGFSSLNGLRRQAKNAQEPKVARVILGMQILLVIGALVAVLTQLQQRGVIPLIPIGTETMQTGAMRREIGPEPVLPPAPRVGGSTSEASERDNQQRGSWRP